MALDATLKIRLEPELLAELEAEAARVERSASAVARRAIRHYLAESATTGKEPTNGS
jgi:predicted transcriptional regulator